MALLGDTHQYEALLGCLSSLPTGQSVSPALQWNTAFEFIMLDILCLT